MLLDYYSMIYVPVAPATDLIVATYFNMYAFQYIPRLSRATVPAVPSGTNVALASKGATVVTSSNNGGGNGYGSAYGDPRNINDGYRQFSAAGGSPSYPGGYWADNSNGGFPKTVEIDFAAANTINLINVFSGQDGSTTSAPTAPNANDAIGQGFLKTYTVAYWDGSSWVTVGSVTNTTSLWNQFSFTAVSTTKILVTISAVDTSGGDSSYVYARVAEIEVLTA